MIGIIPEGVKYNIELQCVLLYQELHKKRNLPAELGEL